MDCSNEEKQAYLHKSIIEAGFSPDDFVEFLTQGHPEQRDIGLWTISDLRIKVDEYKLSKSHSVPETLVGKFDVITDQVMYNIAEQDQQRVQYNIGNLYDNAFSTRAETIPFLLYEKCPVDHPVVEVIRPELKSSGRTLFGFGKYFELWFTIRSNILEGEAARSDADFDWLRKTLVRLHPGQIIPQYDYAAHQGSDISQETRERKASLARYFLNAVGEVEVLANSKLYQAFITWQDYSRFSEFKAIIGKQPTVNLVRNVSSLMSTVSLEISPKNRSINRAIKRYSDQVKQSLDTLHSRVSGAVNDTDMLAASMVKMGDSFAEVQELYSNMCNYAPEIRNNSMNGILIDASNSLIKWAKMISQEAYLLKHHLTAFLEHWRKQHDSVLELLDRRQAAEDQYLKHKLSLLKKKDKQKLEPPESKRSVLVSQYPAQSIAEFEEKELLTLADQTTSKEVELRCWTAYLSLSCQNQFAALYERRAKDLKEIFGRLYSDLVAVSASKQTNFNQIFERAHSGSLIRPP